MKERLAHAAGLSATYVLIHAFYLYWIYRIFDRLPEMTSVTLTANHAFELPFAVSGWYNLLIGPFFIFPAAMILTSKYLKDDTAQSALAFTMVLWGAVSIMAGLYGGMHYGIYIGAILTLVLTTRFADLNTLHGGLLMSLGCGVLIAAKFGFLSGAAVTVILTAFTAVLTAFTAMIKVVYFND